MQVSNQLLTALGKYSDLEIEIDSNMQSLWCYMKPRRSPNFTLYLLRDLYRLCSTIKTIYTNKTEDFPLRYFILSSRISNDVYNYGGDLSLFSRMIREKNRKELKHYAHLCINIIYSFSIHFHTPVTTIALVKGDALAGGLELALTHDVIIAEEKAKFGVPESHFGLFPGMGAYSFLVRRLGKIETEKMIFGGDLYSANHMHKLGIVDVLAPNGRGDEYLRSYISKNDSRYHAMWSLFRIRNRCNPVTYEELIDITNMWVDAALRMSEKDIKRMDRLASAQTRKWNMAISSIQ